MQSLNNPKELTWTCSPIKKNPPIFFVLLAIIVIVSSLVVYWLGFTSQAVVLLIVFLFTIRDLLFPVSCRVNEQGITVSSVILGARYYGWDMIKSFKVAIDGTSPTVELADGSIKKLPPVLNPLNSADISTQLTEWLDWSYSEEENSDVE
jgi:hypothetical protein